MKYMPNWKRRVFTCGSMLYNPNGLRLEAGTARHEEKHSDQQTHYGANWKKPLILKERVKSWWEQYLHNYAFRLAMEIPAYQAQFREYKKVIIDPNERVRLARALAYSLCVLDMDEKLISPNEATDAIRSEKNFTFKV